MKTRKLGLGLTAAILAAAFAVQAEETTRKLSDMNTPGEWSEYQWNKAKARLQVRPEFPEQLKGGGDDERSLGVKATWPGGEGMSFASIVPANPQQLEIPYRLIKISLWVKGPGTGHYGEIHFTHQGADKDKDGKLLKLGFGGQMNWSDWRKIEVTIPADWPQPLAIKSITQHSWNVPFSGESTTYFTRLEATVDASRKIEPDAAAPAAVTDDAW